MKSYKPNRVQHYKVFEKGEYCLISIYPGTKQQAVKSYYGCEEFDMVEAIAENMRLLGEMINAKSINGRSL